MRIISLPNSFFEETADLLNQGRIVQITVQGNSMYPFLHSGDTIKLKPYNGEDLPLYTAVFYKWQGKYMTHRLIKKDGNTFQMLGDGNIYRVETIPKDEIIGVLISCTRPNGKLIDCTSSKWLFGGMLWYQLRYLRRVLFKPLRIIGV